MVEFLTSLLLGFSALLGVKTTPGGDSNWNQTSEWNQVDSHSEYSATSRTISSLCRENPNGYLRLPQVIHGVHQLFLDGRLVYSSGDPTFETATAFYHRPEVSCQLLITGSEIHWKVYSYSRYFSRFKSFPTVSKKKSVAELFDINLNMIAAGALVLLALFSYHLFSKRIDENTTNALALGAIFFASYFTMTTSSEFSLPFDMLTAHKIADTSLFIGGGFYFYVFSKFNYFPENLLIGTNFTLLLFSLIIAFGPTGDVIQFGTTISFPVAFFAIMTVSIQSLKKTIENKSNKQAWLSFTSTMTFVTTATLDVFHAFGIIDTYMILPIGVVAGVFLLALSANQQIEKTYQERDELLLSLENKVAEKTKDLSNALDELKRSEADLIQSAKLASLGTLSAGVAHEINNSINFVNGAIAPLEKKMMSLVPEADRPSLQKLFSAIRHGTDMTVQIVRSLRSFTGLNQAAFREVSIPEIVDSVLTILKSKLREIEITKEVEPSLLLNASQVGLSQVLMNLISNAIDVLPKNQGKIGIKAYRDHENICLEISDNGCGMSTEVQNRIFDPFYTTKDVGKGTGLGLFIVKKEVDRHQGKISVNSKVNTGTTFKILLPIIVSTEHFTENRSAA